MPCCNPIYIVNPNYITSTYKYPEVHGITNVSHYLNTGSFAWKVFHPKRVGVNQSNYKDYFACDPETGDTINIYIQAPCNKCSGCRCAKQFNLRNRMILEQIGRETPMYFVTLTYDNEHLPSDGVSVRDCQLFFKRFRERLKKQFNYDVPFRYTLFSEYGTKYGRPHYHFLLYGFDASKLGFNTPLAFERWLWKTCWKNGFVYVMLCNTGCFNYVSKYILKKSNVPYGKIPNFNLSSRGNGGLGCHALSHPDIIKQIFDGDSTSITVQLYGKVFTFPIPKQILRYKFRYNLQSLRQRYLKHVKGYYHASSSLALLCGHYRQYQSPEILQYIDQAAKVFKSTYNLPLTSPRKVVKVAPYAPEYGFMSYSDTFKYPILSDVISYIARCFYHMAELKKFNIKNMPVFIRNSEELAKFAARISLLVQTDIDFHSLIAAYDSRLNRMLIDNCRDNQ